MSVKDKAASTPTSAPDTAAANPSNPPATGMPEVSGTPDTNVKKNENDVKVLTELIKRQRESGAWISENLNSEEYIWEKISENDTETHLVGIDWWHKGLQGDISFEGLVNLASINCGSNKLTNLDVGNNTLLTRLSCKGSQLVSLDVSKNTSLTSLECEENQLTSLDVSKNNLLTYLVCDEDCNVIGYNGTVQHPAPAPPVSDAPTV